MTGLLAFSMLLAASAIAGNNKGTLWTDETVTVGGKQLPPGKYQVTWAGSGSSVELSISDGRETLAQVPAEILPLKTAQAGSGYSINTDAAGNKALTEILFDGKKYKLSISEASAATTPASDKAQGSN